MKTNSLKESWKENWKYIIGLIAGAIIVLLPLILRLLRCVCALALLVTLLIMGQGLALAQPVNTNVMQPMISTNADGTYTITVPAGSGPYTTTITPSTATTIGQDTLNLGQRIFNSTNMLWEAHGMYAPSLSKKWGGGFGGFYLVNDYVYAGGRVDWVNGDFWMPQGNVGLQYPIKITSWLTDTPFTFGGIGVPLSGATIGGISIGGAAPRDNNGQATAIIGLGDAVKFASLSSTWDIGGLYDAELWTGFSGKQHRFGLWLKKKI